MHDGHPVADVVVAGGADPSDADGPRNAVLVGHEDVGVDGRVVAVPSDVGALPDGKAIVSRLIKARRATPTDTLESIS